MVYLAVKIARSGPPQTGESKAQPITFLQAAAFQWVNPKAWIMCVTACATYTDPDRYTLSVLIVTAVFGLINLPCIAVWVGFGAAMRNALSDPRTRKIFNNSMAILLIASLYPVFRE